MSSGPSCAGPRSSRWRQRVPDRRARARHTRAAADPRGPRGREGRVREVPGVFTEVRAPARDVRLDVGLLPVAIEVVCEGAPLAGAVVRRYAPDGGPLHGREPHWFDMMELMGEPVDEHGVGAPPRPSARAVPARGRARPLHAVVGRRRTGDFDADGRLVVELVRKRERRRRVAFTLACPDSVRTDGTPYASTSPATACRARPSASPACRPDAWCSTTSLRAATGRTSSRRSTPRGRPQSSLHCCRARRSSPRRSQATSS